MARDRGIQRVSRGQQAGIGQAERKGKGQHRRADCPTDRAVLERDRRGRRGGEQRTDCTWCEQHARHPRTSGGDEEWECMRAHRSQSYAGACAAAGENESGDGRARAGHVARHELHSRSLGSALLA